MGSWRCAEVEGRKDLRRFRLLLLARKEGKAQRMNQNVFLEMKLYIYSYIACAVGRKVIVQAKCGSVMYNRCKKPGVYIWI